MRGMYVKPSIKIIHDVIDNPQELILNALHDSIGWNDSAIGGDRDINGNIRNSRELILKGEPYLDMARAVYGEAEQYAKENNFEFSHCEGFTMLEYMPNQGFFDRHSDAGEAFPRSMSALLYLNDVEEGGGTWFDKFQLEVTPTAGTLVLFPANYPYTHQALPPVSSRKWVVVTWFGQKLDRDIFERYYPQ